jgi:energy-converting hydrogenase Eha subunit C
MKTEDRSLCCQAQNRWTRDSSLLETGRNLVGMGSSSILKRNDIKKPLVYPFLWQLSVCCVRTHSFLRVAAQNSHIRPIGTLEEGAVSSKQAGT